MKRFNDEWNGRDDLDFFVDVFLMPRAAKEWKLLDSTKMMTNKMYEEIPATEMRHHGTRKPTTRAKRRASTRKAKRHLREIEPLTMSVRQTRNGAYIRKGDTYGWLPEWKKADHRTARHEGKTVCREYFEDSATETFADCEEDDYPGGTWDTESQEFLWDVEETHNPYFEEIRYWDCELKTHVVRETPNYEFAATFLRERGLHEEFIEWLKGKEEAIA